MLATKVIMKNVRGSFVNILKPRASQLSGQEKYSMTVLLPKECTETKALIDVAIEAALQEASAKKWGGVRPPQPKLPIFDGDGVQNSGEPWGEECKGHWIIRTSSTSKPGFITTQGTPATQEHAYSGAYYGVSVNFYGYEANGNRGISCGLNNVLFIKDGEKIGGAAKPETDFADLLKEMAGQ